MQARRTSRFRFSRRPVFETLEQRQLLTTFYVSTTGSNSNTGADLTTPFLTIQKAADVAQAGDTVLVRGGTYRETISTPRSGTAGAGITFQNYGNETVTVNGADLIAGEWTGIGNEVYVASMNWHYNFENQNSNAFNSNQIFHNGSMLELARWPNQTSADISRPTNAIATGATFSKSSPSLPSNDLTTLSIPSFTENPVRWVGAKIWVNLSRNGSDGQGQTGTVVSATTGSITVTGIDTRGGTGPWSVGAGTEFYLFQPTLSAINATGGFGAALDRGEWFKDPSSNFLYVRTATGEAPAAGSIEAKRRTNGWVLDGDSYITVRGIDLFAATLTTDSLARDRNTSPGGVAVAPASNLLLDSIDAKYVTHFTDNSGNYQNQWQQKSGLIISGSNITLQNSSIQFSAGSGVSVIGQSNKILNNYILDTNYSASNAGALNTGKTNDPGPFMAHSFDHEIAYNSIIETAGMGIHYGALRSSANSETNPTARIHHNFLEAGMLRSGDSGAIDSVSTNHQWVRIDHNIIRNYKGPGTFGIYLDFNTNVIVDHNLVYDTHCAMIINWSSTTTPQNIRAYNNTLLTDNYIRSLENGFGSRNFGTTLRNNIIDGTGDRTNITMLAMISNQIASSPAMYVDPAAGNYQLKSTATTAINTGVSVPPYDDPLVGLPDIGAFEFGAPAWVAGVQVPFIPGDYNRDNSVNVADRAFWAANFGATTSPGLQADGNGDGVVNAADYTFWRDLSTPPAAIAIASAAVSANVVAPLPISLALPWRGAFRNLVGAHKLLSPARARGELANLQLAALEAAFAELGRETYQKGQADGRQLSQRTNLRGDWAPPTTLGGEELCQFNVG